MLSGEAQRHLQRARRLLAVVKARAEVELPEVIAPTAYYSMRHAAMAVLVAHGTASPRTHRGVVALLDKLDREQAWQAKADVALLSRAFSRRLVADHDAIDTLTIEHAKSARDDAITFISFCERTLDVKAA